ncbi:MAG: glycosyltransferase [Spirochaetales bacterium]|nr:glycosyltransferase [Spirochaetales bacterium]
MNSPLITIITATYNCLDTLKKCSESILEQEFKDFEHVIIDGGSNDGTADFIKSLEERDYPLGYWISEKDNGIYDAFNKGVKKAKGKWIYFLGADDFLYDRETLKKTSQELMNTADNIPLVYGMVDCVDSFGYTVKVYGLPWKDAVWETLNGGASGYSVPHQGAFQRKTAFDEVGLFDTSFKIAGDMDMLYRVYNQYSFKGKFIPFFIAKMVMGGLSESHHSATKSFKEMNRVYRKNKIPTDPHILKMISRRNLFHAFLVRNPGIMKIMEKTGIMNFAGDIYRLVKNRKNVINDEIEINEGAIVHYNTTADFGGAAVAANRLFNNLYLEKEDSRFVSVRSSGIMSDGYIFPKTKREKKTIERDYRKSERPLRHYKRRTGFFSCQSSGSDWFHKIDTSKAAIHHFHWIAGGFIDIPWIGKQEKPIVWTLHDMWPFTGGCHYSGGCREFEETCGSCPILNSNKDKDYSRILWEKKLKAYNSSNITVVSPSNWLAEEAKKSSLFKNHDIRVIPNGIDLEKVFPIDKNEAKKSLGIPVDKKVLLFGAVNSTSERRKGVDHLHSYLLQEDRDDLFLLVFGGSLTEKQQDLYSIPSLSLGHINGIEGLKIAYSAADVFIAPSQEENLANTVMEALACGTPVVAFDIGGMPDYIGDGYNGRLVEPFHIGKMKEAIHSILDDKSVEWSINARCMVEENFSIEFCLARYNQLYEELLNVK